MLCAAPSYLAKHPAPRVLSDLAQHQCITTTELQPWTFQTGQQERTLRVAGRLTVNSFAGLHDACIAGAGIALLSSWYTAEYLQSGRLVAIALGDAQPKELAVWAVYPTRRQVLPKVRMFWRLCGGCWGEMEGALRSTRCIGTQIFDAITSHTTPLL
jgi:DNA-binding transcriptional LysR family regulator